MTLSLGAASQPLLEGLPRTAQFFAWHRLELANRPPGFVVLGSSPDVVVELMRHADRSLFGVQTHPELSGPDGRRLLRNFLALAGLALRDNPLRSL